MLIDTDGRCRFTSLERRSLRLTVEHRETPPLVKVALYKLGENVLFFLLGEADVWIGLLAAAE